MFKGFKGIVAVAAAAIAVTSTMSVSAAGVRDIFDAKYYADSYADLQAAFGYDEAALYRHFMTYGIAEGRHASPFFDVQAYRTAYTDLDAAFGNNWDAYVEHYFAYGCVEGRTAGVEFQFNPLEYAAAYPDVAAACGGDAAAIIRHYVEFGMKEGRSAGVTVVEKEEEAKEAESVPVVNVPVNTPESNTGSGGDSTGGNTSDDNQSGWRNPVYTDYDLAWVSYCDENGNEIVSYCFNYQNNKLVKIIIHDVKDGDFYGMAEYDADGNKKVTYYTAEDVILRMEEYDNSYNNNLNLENGKLLKGNLIRETVYDAYGLLAGIIEYDKEGNVIKETYYDDVENLFLIIENVYDEGALVFKKCIYADGSYEISEIDDNKKEIKTTKYDVNGEAVFYSLSEYYENGFIAKRTFYNMSGIIDTEIEYSENGIQIKITYYQNGHIMWVGEYDDDGKHIRDTYYQNGVIVNMSEYDANERRVKTTYYDENGEAAYYAVPEYDASGSVAKTTYYDMDGNVKE